MMKLVWLSDPHFAAEGLVLGTDPRARLYAAIDYINTNYSDAAGCVISGDLVNRGTEADYIALSHALSKLKVPVFPLVGNHDDRRLVRTYLPLPETVMDSFIQYEVVLNGVSILCVDTQKDGADAGALCKDRLAWLKDARLRATNRPTLLFGHHPPLELGLPMQDQDRLEDSADFCSAVTNWPQLKHMCFGHVHRTTCGSVHGIPFATLRSALYQAPSPRPDWDWSTFRPAREAPQMGIIAVSEHETVIQFHDFCGPDFGVPDT